MKKIIILTILISAFALISIAQSTRYFEKIIGPVAPYGENTNVVLQLISGNYITLGAGSNNLSSQHNTVFIKTDAYGNSEIDSVYSDIMTVTNWYDAKFLDNGNIIAAADYYVISSGYEKMRLSKMDTTGQIIWSSFVGDTIYPTSPQCIRKTLDGGYILGGITDEVPSKLVVVKTNPNGLQLWELRIGGTTYDNGINSCLLYTSPSPRDRQKSRMPSSA